MVTVVCCVFVGRLAWHNPPLSSVLNKTGHENDASYEGRSLPESDNLELRLFYTRQR